MILTIASGVPVTGFIIMVIKTTITAVYQLIIQFRPSTSVTTNREVESSLPTFSFFAGS